jgi:hypothetical protein
MNRSTPSYTLLHKFLIYFQTKFLIYFQAFAIAIIVFDAETAKVESFELFPRKVVKIVAAWKSRSTVKVNLGRDVQSFGDFFTASPIP